MSELHALLEAALAASAAKRNEALLVLLGKNKPSGPAGGFVETEPYLSLRQLSRRLGVSRSSLWRWKVPKRSLGGHPRFLLSEVLSYLDSTGFQRRAAALRAERRQVTSSGRKPDSDGNQLPRISLTAPKP